MIITNLKEEHINQIVEIEKECFSEPWSKKSFEGELENENAFYLIAENENSEVLGYIGCHCILDEGYITNVAVSKKARRQKVASGLVFALISLAKEKELAFLTLEVREKNESAINLYVKNGFRRLGMRKDYYEKPRENALLMTLYL